MEDDLSEPIELLAVRPDGRTVEVTLEASMEETWLQVSVEGSEWTRFAGSNLFVALIAARIDLESKGLLLCCQGARPNVFPSGMLQQTANGRFAYELKADKTVAESEVVDIFEPASAAEVDTVERQKLFVFDFFGLAGH